MKVFIHGVPDTPHLWKPLIAALGLEPADYFAPALPGFGTPVPKGFACTKDAYVDYLIAEIEKLDQKIDLVSRSVTPGPNDELEYDLDVHEFRAQVRVRVYDFLNPWR